MRIAIALILITLTAGCSGDKSRNKPIGLNIAIEQPLGIGVIRNGRTTDHEDMQMSVVVDDNEELTVLDVKVFLTNDQSNGCILNIKNFFERRGSSFVSTELSELRKTGNCKQVIKNYTICDAKISEITENIVLRSDCVELLALNRFDALVKINRGPMWSGFEIGVPLVKLQSVTDIPSSKNFKDATHEISANGFKLNCNQNKDVLTCSLVQDLKKGKVVIPMGSWRLRRSATSYTLFRDIPGSNMLFNFNSDIDFDTFTEQFSVATKMRDCGPLRIELEEGFKSKTKLVNPCYFDLHFYELKSSWPIKNGEPDYSSLMTELIKIYTERNKVK